MSRYLNRPENALKRANGKLKLVKIRIEKDGKVNEATKWSPP